MAPGKKRSSRIGPHDGCEIKWPSHGKDRFVERVLGHGVRIVDFENLIRSPNSKWKDEKDPHHSGTRFRRWVQVEQGGVSRPVRVVYEVDRESSDPDRGSIRIVSVMFENQRMP